MQSYHLNVMFSGRLVTCYVFVSFHRSRGVGCYRNITHVLGERQQFLNFERFYGNRSMATGVDKASQCNASRNRLALERSPYLLQHASNPVDWYPWGEEAFEKAREQNKLIFLSVGYSTCHWCHVMERESFENQDIANVMNAHFINIKVDREERPDLDKVYMAFIQAITRGGGWPMSVWLTPQLTPVFGGTYFPPADNGGRAGFKTVLLNVQEQWENNRLLFLESGVKILDVLQDSASLEAPTLAEVPGPECAAALLLLYVRHYEPRHGGFGPAPKFPQVSNFEFLLNHYARDPDSEGAQRALDMCVHTLTCMARGGIHDHVSQGFARYSTDDRWHVPHFEKMLYDQGQLAVAYANAYAVTKNQLFAETLEDILTYVNRDLSHESGGFYSAEDADSLPTPSSTEKKEGAFCVWTHREVVDLLAPLSKKHAEAFAFHYNVKPEGNVAPRQDPHGELRHQNVLHVSDSDEATAEAVGLEVEALRDVLAECRRVLFEARQARPRPHLDSKMIAAWNGLMISGFARAAQVLRSAAHERRAVRAAEFVRDNLFDRTSGTLLRSCYRGEDGEIAQIAVPILGFLDDYAYMIRGLLDLFETCFDCEWLDWAEQLQDTQDKLFGDEEAGGYYNSPAADVTVVLRLKEGQDGAEPSGNSVSASNLLRLAAYLDRSDLSDRAARLLVAFSARLAQLPLAVPGMVAALTVYHDSVTHVFVTGERSDPDTAALLDVIHSRLVPGRVLALAPSRADAPVCVKCAAVLGMKPLAGKAAAYVCRHRACSLPVNTPEALAELLDRRN